MEYDIYDPSNSVDGGYWQNKNADHSSKECDQWHRMANLINQGLPIRETKVFRCTAPERNLVLWGCTRQEEVFWAYRIFLTGYDNHARPGRYFFVLFKLNSLDELGGQMVSKIITHLEFQTGIPLDLAVLSGISQDSEAAECLTNQFLSGTSASRDIDQLSKRVSGMPNGRHLGFVFGNGQIAREYTDLPCSWFEPETTDHPENCLKIQSNESKEAAINPKPFELIRNEQRRDANVSPPNHRIAIISVILNICLIGAVFLLFREHRSLEKQIDALKAKPVENDRKLAYTRSELEKLLRSLGPDEQRPGSGKVDENDKGEER